MSGRKPFLLCAALVGVLLFLPSPADAGPFGLFGRNKVAKQVQAPGNNSSCVLGENGKCLTHGGSQSTNNTGTGPVTAANLQGAGGAFYVQAPESTKANAEAADVPAETVPASAESNAVAATKSVVVKKEAELAEAKAAAARAVEEDRRANEKLRLDLQNEIKDERAASERRIDDLTAQLAALETEE